MSEPSSLAAALVAFQADAPDLQRDKINPHFRSAYLSLETLLAEVLPVLSRHGLAVTQLPTSLRDEAGKPLPALRTRLIHSSGEYVEDTMLLLAAKQDPQGQGSAITYGRRYMLMAMLGLSADEDDDGNAATSGASKKRQQGGATKISADQVQRLYAVASAAKVSAADAKAIIKRVAGVESSKDIPRAKYDAVVGEIEKVAA